MGDILTATVIIIAYIAGFLTAIVVKRRIFRHSKYGKFLIDTRDPNKDIYRLEWDKDPSDIRMRKWIVLDIDPTAQFDSRE